MCILLTIRKRQTIGKQQKEIKQKKIVIVEKKDVKNSGRELFFTSTKDNTQYSEVVGGYYLSIRNVFSVDSVS